MNDDARHTLTHGGFGLSVGMIGAVTSLLPQIEQWLRIIVLLLSLVATVLSIWKLWRGRKGGEGPGASMPAWTAIIALLLCVIFFAACSPSGPVGTPVPVESREMHTTVRASDGNIYRLVRKAREAAPGSVSEVDLWQPLGAAGQGLPAYTRRLQSASDTSDPIMIKAGVLE